MVDVGAKTITKPHGGSQWLRQDVARPPSQRFRERPHAQGRFRLKTARLAGIMAAKRTAELIPLCHFAGAWFGTPDVQITPDR